MLTQQQEEQEAQEQEGLTHLGQMEEKELQILEATVEMREML